MAGGAADQPEGVAGVGHQPDHQLVDDDRDGGGVQHGHCQHPLAHPQADVSHALPKPDIPG